MRNLEKYKGVIPAFYACYDNEGNVSPEGVQALTKVLCRKRCERCICERFVRRMYLPERGRP